MKYSAAAPETLQMLVDQLSSAGSDAAAQGGRNGSCKAAVVTKIWTQVLQSNSKKEELLKVAVLPRLLSMMEATAADSEGGYSAAGCLSCLVQHPKWLAEVTATGSVTNKVICACLTLLNGSHDRSRLPAAQVLLALSRQPGVVPKLEPCLDTLLKLLAHSGGPGWAGGRQLATAAAGVLQALLEPSEYETEAVKQARRQSCCASGVVPALIRQLQGANEALLLATSACLRFMALAPGAAEVLAGDPAVAQQLLQLLTHGRDGVRAFVGGALWELAAAQPAAQQLLDAGAVPALMHVVHDAAAAAAGSRKGGNSIKKSGKGEGKESSASAAKGSAKTGGTRPVSGAGSSSRGKGGEGAAPPASVLLQDPAAAAAVALCNVTGALHHLSFNDDAKLQLGQSPQLQLLVKLLTKATGQTYDNIVGCLWNVGLLPENTPLLAAAGAPAHLVQPVPARWTCAAGAAEGPY